MLSTASKLAIFLPLFALWLASGLQQLCQPQAETSARAEEDCAHLSGRFDWES